MPIAQSATDYIYEGVWTNLQKGRVIGLTLTVSQSHAAILSPALAVLIAIAGAQLWQLFQYALHQARATSARRNFLFHQQQSSLRNSGADLNTLWRLIRLAIAWRHQKDVRVLRTTLPLLCWTLLHLSLVILAGLFSSTFLNAGDQVLTRSPWCGWFNETYVDGMYAKGPLSDNIVEQIMEFSSYLNSAYANIQQHVDACSSSAGCDAVPTLMPNFTSNILPGACPFQDSVCHPAIPGSISFDTGYLSSFSDFGFNAAKDDRISYRLVAECAPLNDARYVSSWQNINATNDDSAYQIADAYYGPSSVSGRNATFSAVKQYTACEQRKVTSPYILSAQYAVAGGSVKKGTASFDSIPELQNKDADLGLVLLNFNGAYQGAVSDPWFSALRVASDNTTYCDHEERTLYSRELPITTIGCTQRWQMCNKDASPDIKDNSCTPLLSFYQLQRFVKSVSNSTLPLNPQQQATFNRIIQVSNGAFFHEAISHLSQSNTVPLQARHLMTKTVSLALPENQWQIETEYWFTIILTYLQQVSLQISTGQFAASTDYISVTRPSAKDSVQNAAYHLCQNQIIRSHDYENFNFFALLVVVVLCVIVTVLGLTIEDIVGSIRQRQVRWTENDGKQQMWKLNSDLEMLKVISELKDGTKWTVSKNGVPVAQPGHEIGILELGLNNCVAEEEKGVVDGCIKTRLGQSVLRDISTSHMGEQHTADTTTTTLNRGMLGLGYGHDKDILGTQHSRKYSNDDGLHGGVLVYEHEIPHRNDQGMPLAFNASLQTHI